MTTVKHPTLNHAREVRERDVDEWLAAGWLLVSAPEPVPELVEETPVEAVPDVEDEAPKNSQKRQPRKG